MYKAVLVFLTLVITGCSTMDGPSQYPGPIQGGENNQYPVEIKGMGGSKGFPLEVAGFMRGKILAYKPGLNDISVAYNLGDGKRRVASTIYMYPANISLENEFEGIIQAMAVMYPGAKIIKTERLVLSKNSQKYDARQVTYDYQIREGSLFFQLLIFKHEEQFIKLRSTSQLDQAEDTLVKNSELLEGVNWAS